jgi:hypothetical protein
MKKVARRSRERVDVPKPDSRFLRVVDAFAGDRQVSRGGGKGFGSGALKVRGKIFAMMSSRGKFVVKLPKRRVDELVAAGQGEYFDPGHGRLMKEWLQVQSEETSWIELAKEAHRFVCLKDA